MTVVERGQRRGGGGGGSWREETKKRRGNDGSRRMFSKQKKKRQRKTNARKLTSVCQQSQSRRVGRLEEVSNSMASSFSSSICSSKGELEDNNDGAELGSSSRGSSSRRQSRGGLSVAKTGKGRRELQKRQPQLIEGTRKCLCMKGGKVSSQVQLLLKNVHRLMAPNCIFLSRRRQKNFFPFEDCSTAEYLCQKNQASLFCLGSSSKKRPFRLVLGRMFNYALLDQYEFNVSDFEPMESFRKLESPIVGSKPLLVLQGEAFQRSSVSSALGNFLSDFFRGSEVSKLCLETIDRAIVITALPLRCDDQKNEKKEEKVGRVEWKRGGREETTAKEFCETDSGQTEGTLESKESIASSYSNPRDLPEKKEEKHHKSVNQSEPFRQEKRKEEEEEEHKKVSASSVFPFALRFRHYRISLKKRQKNSHHHEEEEKQKEEEEAKGTTAQIRLHNDLDSSVAPSSSSSARLLVLPQVELEDVGPSFTLSLDRYRLPADDRWAAAMKAPRLSREKKVKNVSGNVLGEKKGRVHVGTQDWRGIHTPHFHGGNKQKKKKRGSTTFTDNNNNHNHNNHNNYDDDDADA